MDLALVEQTETFIRYALDDALVLYPIFQKMIAYTNSIMKNSLGMPSYFQYSEETMKYSNGSLVASTFEKFLYFYCCGKPKTYKAYSEKMLKVKCAFMLKFNHVDNSFNVKKHTKVDINLE